MPCTATFNPKKTFHKLLINSYIRLASGYRWLSLPSNEALASTDSNSLPPKTSNRAHLANPSEGQIGRLYPDKSLEVSAAPWFQSPKSKLLELRRIQSNLPGNQVPTRNQWLATKILLQNKWCFGATSVRFWLGQETSETARSFTHVASTHRGTTTRLSAASFVTLPRV